MNGLKATEVEEDRNERTCEASSAVLRELTIKREALLKAFLPETSRPIPF